MLNLKLAFRHLLKNRLTTALNVLGLAVGMAAFLLINNYVKYEGSFDQFYQKSEQVFRLTTLWEIEGDEEHYATTPPPLAETVRATMPEVEAICRVFYWSDFTMRPDHDFEQVYRETAVYAVDTDFFKVLDYGLIAGDPETALQEPASVILPRSVAIKYFGQEAFDTGNVLGRQLKGGKDGGTPWEVTGVMKDQPENSHLQFDFLISASTYPDDLYRNQVWSWNVMHTYLRIKDTSPAALAGLQQKLKRIATDYTLPNMPFAAEDELKTKSANFDYPLQPIADIHLHSNLIREMRPNGNATYVNIFLMVAYLIMLMAGINFINLATAQASRRAAQTGIRKILGAGYGQLVRQHLSESVLTCVVAGTVAVAGIFILQELIGSWFGTEGIQAAVGNGFAWPTLLALTLGTGVLAGLYPAFYLSRFRPADALKGRQLAGVSDRGLRNGLVVFQLVLSIALVAGSMIVYQQVSYFQEKELGFAKNNVLVIENDREIEERKDVFKDELLRHPSIVAAGFSNGLPAQPTYQMRNFRAEGKSLATGINWILADDSFLPTLNLELLAGENFKARSGRDSSSIILNESAVKLLELEEPLGTVLIKNEGRDDEERLQIIGVIKDFHLQSPQQEIAPLAISFFKDFVFKDYISIRLGEDDIAGAMAHIESKWDAFEPGVPLRYSFLDENYNQLFRSETQLGKLFGVFTALAMFIAGLGLFGLVTLMLSERTKEIGIRKVLGASVGQIVLLFSKQFFVLVGLAFLIAAPLIWYGGQQWLQNFASRIDLSLWPILLALVATLLLTATTVGWRSANAARNNPVEALKNE